MRRIIVTGAATRLGTVLAQQLLAEPAVELVAALDTRPPELPAGDRLVHVDVDLRSPDLARVLVGLRADALVHTDLLQFPEPGRSARTLHDTNVVGTLGLLAAAEALPELRTLVVRGSAALYGSEPNAPAFFTEDMAGRFELRTRWQRDVSESEKLVEGFARRRPAVTCTTLRFQPIVGRTLDTPIMRLIVSPVVPTWMGFDPMIQVIHGDDAVAAMIAAIDAGVRGPVNVAARDTISLSRALRRLGKTALPLAPGLYGTVLGAAARLGLPRMDEDTMRFLRYGRGVDTTRMEQELGFVPVLGTIGAIELVAMAFEEAAA